MNSSARPALFTTVDCASPLTTRPDSTYKSGNVVQTSGATSFHTGVPFIVLTDGKTWSFYLPAEQGSYEERRVYKLDLFERSATEAVEILTKFLSHGRVESGSALEAARTQYRDRNRRAQARAEIPTAWRELVEAGDELLVDLLASAVESKVGVRPELDDVAEYLNGLGRLGIQAQISIPQPVQVMGQRAAPQPVQRVAGDPPRAGNLLAFGQTHHYNNAKEAMVTVLRLLAERDSQFLERCSRHPNAQGRTRRYIAQSPDDLYPDRPDLKDFNEQLPGGWFVSTNLNNVLKRTIIRMAAEVANVGLGTDLVVEI